MDTDNAGYLANIDTQLRIKMEHTTRTLDEMQDMLNENIDTVHDISNSVQVSNEHLNTMIGSIKTNTVNTINI